jgi:hypothetical protein
MPDHAAFITVVTTGSVDIIFGVKRTVDGSQLEFALANTWATLLPPKPQLLFKTTRG